VEEHHAVVAVGRGVDGCPRLAPIRDRGAVLVEGVFYDPALLDKIFKELPIRAVIHLAALRGTGLGTREDYHRINVVGTERLLEACLRHCVGRFVFCSSVGVFGTIPQEVPASLQTRLMGDNEYHTSKVLAEDTVREYVRKGLDAYIVRPTITYGEGDTGFPATLVTLVQKGMFLLPRRDPRIHLLDVEKLSEILVTLLEVDGVRERVFLVGDRDPIRLRDLVDMISRQCRGKPYPSWLCAPDGAVSFVLAVLRMTRRSKWAVRLSLISQDWYYDISRTVSLLNFTPAETRGRFQSYLRQREGERIHPPAARGQDGCAGTRP
jgi:nucleoside-diphosphate-sugar epimerase